MEEVDNGCLMIRMGHGCKCMNVSSGTCPAA